MVPLGCSLGLVCALLAAAPALAASPPGPSALTPSSSSLGFFAQDMHNPSPSITETYTNNSGTPTTVQSAQIIGLDASSELLDLTGLLRRADDPDHQQLLGERGLLSGVQRPGNERRDPYAAGRQREEHRHH
jgi:hypothetical protein